MGELSKMKVAIALSVVLVATSYAMRGSTTGANDIVPEVSLASAKQAHDNSVSQMSDTSEDLQHCETCAEQAVLKMQHEYHQCADGTCDAGAFRVLADKAETQFKRAVRDAKELAPKHHDEIDQVESKCLAQLTALKDDHHDCSNDSTKCGKDGFDIGVGKLRDDCDFRHDLSDLDVDSSVLLQPRARGGESPKQQLSSSHIRNDEAKVPAGWPASVRYTTLLQDPKGLLPKRRWTHFPLGTPLPNGPDATLFLDDTPRLKGKGVFTRARLPQGRHVADYTCEVKTHDEADGDNTFLLDLGFGLEIDASKSGGIGRFINDYRGQTAKPNCQFEKMQDVHGRPFVRLVTTRRVEPGEQLFVDYGRPFWVRHRRSMVSRDELTQMQSEQLSTSLEGKKIC